MRTLLHLFFILFSLFAQAQERKRIVVDFTTNKPVPYATIKVLHTTHGKIASGNGEFTVDIKANDSILITSVGYYDALLIGKEISDKITLTPKPNILETVTVKTKKVVNKFILGNGADLIEKNFKCKPDKGSNDNCMLWSFGSGAEFAEPITLPDSLRTYRLSKVYIPVNKSGCWQPIFLQVYELDSITRGPGNLILKKYLSLESEIYKKGKITIDLSNDNIYLSKMKRFFISISWPTDTPNDNCLTALVLVKSLKGICYSRNLQSPDYRWFIFDGNTLQQKGTEGRFHTLLAAEIEALED